MRETGTGGVVEVRRSRTWVSWAITGAAAVTLVATAVLVIGSGGHDDSHITFWVADAVARGWGFVNYDGAAVEQSSSLTFVVLLALLNLVTRVPVPVLGYVLGLVAGGAAVVQGHRLAERLAPGTGPFAAWMTATVFCLAYWSTSGMEASLAAALVPTLVLAVGDVVGDGGGAPAGRWRWVGLLLVALAFTGVRPEYTFVSLGVAAATVVFGVRTGADRRRMWAAAGTVAASVAMVAGFRGLVFGKALPNPAAAKAGGFDFAEGATYLLNVARESNVALVVLGAAGAYLGLHVLVSRGARSEPRALSVGLTAALVAALLAFPVAAGGDWMRHGRFLVPAVAILAVASVALVRLLPRRGRGVARGVFVVVALVGGWTATNRMTADRHLYVTLAAAQELSAQIADKAGPHEFSRVELANPAHLRDAPLVVHLLRILEQIGPTPEAPITLVSGQAGMVPYYAALHHYGRLRFIDMYSLTTDEIARCWPQAIQGRSQLGTLLSYPKILRPGELERRCGIARPDIVFSPGLRGKFADELKKNGYVVVYQQTGRAPGKRGHDLPGFIAVREELAQQFDIVRRDHRW